MHYIKWTIGIVCVSCLMAAECRLGDDGVITIDYGLQLGHSATMFANLWPGEPESEDDLTITLSTFPQGFGNCAANTANQVWYEVEATDGYYDEGYGYWCSGDIVIEVPGAAPGARDRIHIYAYWIDQSDELGVSYTF